jgi:hypothetical protein
VMVIGTTVTNFEDTELATANELHAWQAGWTGKTPPPETAEKQRGHSDDDSSFPFHGARATPNDRKLSDGGRLARRLRKSGWGPKRRRGIVVAGGWVRKRSLCGRSRPAVGCGAEGVVKGSVEGRLARCAAQTVTPGAVRCSALVRRFGFGHCWVLGDNGNGGAGAQVRR